MDAEHTTLLESQTPDTMLEGSIETVEELVPDERDLFRKGLSPNAARNLFRAWVRQVSLEPFNYCNRKCAYCPVSLVDRKSATTLLDWSIYSHLVDNLGEIDFDGLLTLQIYNEPLGRLDDFLKYLQYASATVGRATLNISTNGDYLTPRVLERLAEGGLDQMTISVHPKAGTAYCDQTQLTLISKLSMRLGLVFHFDEFSPSSHISAHSRFDRIDIKLRSVNYDEKGQNRAGTLAMKQDFRRTAPCSRPFRDVTVSYAGVAFPCCQFFADDSRQAPYRIELSPSTSIYDIFASEIMVDFRRRLFTHGLKSGPCQTCDEGQVRLSAEENTRRDAVLKAALTSS